MPVSLTTLTGPVYLPSGATPVGGRVSFELSSWDREAGEALILSGPVYATIDNDGNFSASLFTSTEGENGVHYKMFVLWTDSELAQSYVNDLYISTPTPHYTKKYIGSFALSGVGPFRVADLNIVSELTSNTFDVYTEVLAMSLAVETAKNDVNLAASAVEDMVEAFAANVSLHDTLFIDTLASYPADTVISYEVGTGHVNVGDHVLTRVEGLSLEVLAPGAAAYTHINANNVKANLVSRATHVPASVADQFTTAKYDIIGGVLRQNSADRTQWNFLNDSAHVPVGFNPARPLLASDGTTNLAPRAAGQTLLFFFKHTTDARQINVADNGYYDRVSAVNAWADETLSKDWGIALGAKVTRSGLTVYGSMHKTRHGRIYWSGSSWQITEDTSHPTGAVTVSYDAGSPASPGPFAPAKLTVNHGWLPGNNLRVEPDARAGIPTSLFNPIVYNRTNTSFEVVFQQEGGAGPGFGFRQGTEGVGMCFRWTKSYDGPVTFDGTNGWDVIPWDENGTGNIWVQGIMRREAPV